MNNKKPNQFGKNQPVLRNKRQVKQINQRIAKTSEEIEAAKKIQKWWKRQYSKLALQKYPYYSPEFISSRDLAPYHLDNYRANPSKISFDFEESFAEKPAPKSTTYEDTSRSIGLNSSIQSKAAELMQYLEESEIQYKSKPEISMPYNSQATIMNYKLELEESLKTIETLKIVIQRQKKEALVAEEENKKNLEEALKKQRIEYEEIGLKNISFIEQLLGEKQQRITQLTELNNKIKEMETKHQKNVLELKETYAKELKKQKDAWITSENNKRNNWMKEKTKEIKENTTKGLEPEIMRIMAENKRIVERIKEEQQAEVKSIRNEIEIESEKKIQEFKDEIKAKYDEMLEKERESYQEKLRELHFKQEEELLNMRKRWNDDMNSERSKLQDLRSKEESKFQQKIRTLEEEFKSKLEDLNEKHRKTIEDLEKSHENKYKKLKNECNIEKDEWIQSQMAKLSKEFEEKKESLKIDLVQNRDKELKLVISKLSEEKVAYKKKIEKECEIKLKMQKEKHDLEISDYEKLIENLKEKIEKSTHARKNLDENFQTLGKKIQDQELTILKLEGEKMQLKDVITGLEVKIQNYKEGQGEVIEEVRKEEKRKQMKLEEEISVNKEQIELLKERYEEKLAMITQKEAEEFEAIETRVKATIMKKDEKIREVQEELQISRIKISKLEELLEKQRKNLMQL